MLKVTMLNPGLGEPRNFRMLEEAWLIRRVGQPFPTVLQIGRGDFARLILQTIHWWPVTVAKKGRSALLNLMNGAAFFMTDAPKAPAAKPAVVVRLDPVDDVKEDSQLQLTVVEMRYRTFFGAVARYLGEYRSLDLSDLNRVERDNFLDRWARVLDRLNQAALTR